MDDLRTNLLTHEIENYDIKTFIPFKDLKLLLTEQVISSLLRHTDIDAYLHNEIIRTVTFSALQLFAILIVIRETQSIQRFIVVDQATQPSLDSKLPFEGETLRQIWSKSEK